MDTLSIEDSMMSFQPFLDKDTSSCDVPFSENISIKNDVCMGDLLGNFDPVDNNEEDFSWLFKILPPLENHEVPQANTIRLEYQQNIDPQPIHIKTQYEKSAEICQSTMIDPLLSEICVTPLLTETDTEAKVFTSENSTTINDSLFFHEDKENLENHSELSTKRGGKQRQRRLTRRVTTRRNSNILKVQTNIIETPLSSTRHQRRKRSFAEILAVDTERFLGTETTNLKRKRAKTDSVESAVTSDVSTPTLPDKANNSHCDDKVDDAPKESSDNLKIKFRKSKPVNPLGSKRYIKMLMQKQLLDTSEHLTSELYFSHGITPLAFPIRNIVNDNNTIIANKLLDVSDIRMQMCLENIKSHNEKAYNSAHGTVPDKGRKKFSTPHISGVKRQRKKPIAKLDLDSQYDTLLASQKAFALSMKSNPKQQEVEEKVDNNLESSFMNAFQFDDYFDEMDKQKKKSRSRNIIQSTPNSLTGAVRVKSQMLRNKQFFANQTIFNYQGLLYRPNPAVVTLTRIPDETLELMQMPPCHPSITSPYYAALTSYFDKKKFKQ